LNKYIIVFLFVGTLPGTVGLLQQVTVREKEKQKG
jgi:hypothetical protein